MTANEARDAAEVIAREIVSGGVDPYEGATRIWKDVLDQLGGPIPDDLWPFKSNASAIEDCLWDAEASGSNHDATIQQSRDEIMQAAEALHRARGKR